MMATTVFMSAPIANGQLIRIIGQGTLEQSQAVRDIVTGALEQGHSVVIDLSQCDYVDSAFMGGLIWLHKFAGERSTDQLTFYASEKKIRELFGPSLLDRVLNIVGDRPEPTEEFTVVATESDQQSGLSQFMADCDRRFTELVERQSKPQGHPGEKPAMDAERDDGQASFRRAR